MRVASGVLMAAIIAWCCGVSGDGGMLIMPKPALLADSPAEVGLTPGCMPDANMPAAGDVSMASPASTGRLPPPPRPKLNCGGGI